jgi:hypothetical protein
VSKNALKLVHSFCQFKKFSGSLYPARTSVLKVTARLEGTEGREWEGKKDETEGKAGRGGREKGGKIVKVGVPTS